MAKGVDPARIAKDPTFQRSRENAAEFGRAVQAAKYLRNLLRPLLLHCPDGSMPNRLHSRMLRILKADSENGRGERKITASNTAMLRHFNFNQQMPIHETLVAPYQVTTNHEQRAVQLQLPSFHPTTGIVAPKGATHFQVVSASVLVDFQDIEGEYPPLLMDTSEVLALSDETPPFALTMPLPEEAIQGSLLVLLGIWFFQHMHMQVYPMPTKGINPLAIVKVMFPFR